jgi:hypothetical protein
LVFAAATDLEDVQFDGVAANVVAPGKSLPRIFEFLVEASTVSDDLGKLVQDFFRAGVVQNFGDVLCNTENNVDCSIR